MSDFEFCTLFNCSMMLFEYLRSYLSEEYGDAATNGLEKNWAPSEILQFNIWKKMVNQSAVPLFPNA